MPAPPSSCAFDAFVDEKGRALLHQADLCAFDGEEEKRTNSSANSREHYEAQTSNFWKSPLVKDVAVGR